MNRSIVLIISFLFALSFAGVYAQPKVFVLKIRAEIDPRMARYVRLGLEEARNVKADYLVVDMDTYGGAVNDADEIRSRLLEFEKPVWVFINKNAASAGALISLACDSIYMEKGANIGAATVVNGSDGMAAPDKYQSYMRSMMRSTAEANGRDPKIAEAMVDQNLEIEGITEAGQVLTFTASEALKHGFCDGMAETLEEVLQKNGLEKYELVSFELGNSERIISFFLNPFVSGLLILIMIGGIYFELQTPGVGFPLAAALVAALLYFTPYYLNGLAAYWEIIAFIIGLGLLFAEIFVIPGFGIAGISGILLIAGSLILVMLDNDWFDFSFVASGKVTEAAAATLSGMFASLLLIVFGLSYLPNSKLFSKVIQKGTMSKDDGFTAKFVQEDLVGMIGAAHTVLRPSGKVMINNKVYDACTRGEFLEKGTEIKVISDEGTTLRVQKIS